MPRIRAIVLKGRAFLCRKMFGLVLALALQAVVLHSAQASCDITDLGCIAKDFKASLQVNQGSFESEYQQFAEMIAPVLLLAHGGDFEVQPLSAE